MGSSVVSEAPGRVPQTLKEDTLCDGLLPTRQEGNRESRHGASLTGPACGHRTRGDASGGHDFHTMYATPNPITPPANTSLT